MTLLILLGAFLLLWAMSYALSNRVGPARGRGFLCLTVVALLLINANTIVGKPAGGATAQAMALSKSTFVVAERSAVVVVVALVVCTGILAVGRKTSDDNPGRQRRWFRFSLRALFVVVTVVAALVCWSLRWPVARRSVPMFNSKTGPVVFAAGRRPYTAGVRHKDRRWNGRHSCRCTGMDGHPDARCSHIPLRQYAILYWAWRMVDLDRFGPA